MYWHMPILISISHSSVFLFVPLSLSLTHIHTPTHRETAVGLYQSEVKGHILLFINRGSGDYEVLKDRLGQELWPQNSLIRFLFVLVNGLKSNGKSLAYFGLMSRDLPRVGIYDDESAMKCLMHEGEISTHS
uniref:Uncharacterized protein n=1 Tax=Oncorhynchus kisutch TaxID=8019 RepID=A0A8C7JCE3_ONCKI